MNILNWFCSSLTFFYIYKWKLYVWLKVFLNLFINFITFISELSNRYSDSDHDQDVDPLGFTLKNSSGSGSIRIWLRFWSGFGSAWNLCVSETLFKILFFHHNHVHSSQVQKYFCYNFHNHFQNSKAFINGSKCYFPFFSRD